MSKFFTTFDGLKLSYSDEGQGPAILCLPGLTRNQYDFDEFVASNTREARVITFTFRGRWPSDYDSNPQNYNGMIEAQDTIALLDHLGIDKAMIIGTSRGGLVAMALAQFAKDRLAGVVFNDVGPKIEVAALERISGYLGVQPNWQSAEEGAKALQAVYRDEFPDFDLIMWQKLAERWFDCESQPTKLRYDPDLKQVFDLTPKDIDLWPFYDQMEGIPLGVIRGANSDLLTRETVSEMRKRRPDLVSAEVPDRGHVPLLDELEAQSVISEVFALSFGR